ncbi:MAG: LapA family protein [Sphingomonas fennica]
MNFLKTLFWIAITVVAVVFATNNWHAVTLNLWAGLQADAKLPVLLFVSFLVGFLPTWLWHRARLWQVRRQVEQRPLPVAAEPYAAPAMADPAPAPIPTQMPERAPVPLPGEPLA